MGKQNVVVVGGGAAGFFSAINIAEKTNAEVRILEKTGKLLTKVKVSGGGRCNVTHACFDPRELATYYPRGEKELIGPFHHYSTGDVIAWFAERNIELKMEEDGRMFPTTDSSQTIIDCFLKEAKKHAIQIQESTAVLEVKYDEGFQIITSNGNYVADQLVIAIGGNPNAKHYALLEKLGHTIVPPIPSLFTFNLPKHPSNQLMGLSHEVLVRISGTKYEELGPLLFTHWGMSGPAILKLSSKAAKWLHQKQYQFEFTIEWTDSAADYIADMRRQQGSKKVSQSKLDQMPTRLWHYLLDRAEIPLNKNWSDLNRNQIQRLENTLSHDRYQAKGKTTFKEEFVTCGGVALEEIDLKRMESKKVKNLFFCGEVMNIDALTGGFNFQSAWTTAFRVAEALK